MKITTKFRLSLLSLFYDYGVIPPHPSFNASILAYRHWTLPNFSTAKQSERWSDLMPLMTWQLWLARDLVEDFYLLWQSPLKNLTPGRVAQSIFSLLLQDLVKILIA